MSHSINDDNLANVERILQAFEPNGGRLNSSRIMFLAGQAAARKELSTVSERSRRIPWYWPVGTMASCGLSIVLAVALFMRTEREIPVVRDDSARVNSNQIAPLPDETSVVQNSDAALPDNRSPSLTGATSENKSWELSSHWHMRQLASEMSFDFATIAPVQRVITPDMNREDAQSPRIDTKTESRDPYLPAVIRNNADWRRRG